ncbi:MAG: pyrimidine dimer DNA glycosylase/endonuclease V [Candidatus Latescibacterota bacterium]|nr:pyrimidine dimer DNA glycosylase/endonuclease V [Candidatus Latescibacterota bacterium]
MNIFVLHNDPETAASMVCDKHVVKMILETAQMMCTVVASHGHDTPYRPTHKKHPCTLWAGKSRANWSWLIDHGMAMSEEYTRRYGRVHKSQSVIEWCAMKHIDLPDTSLTPFAQAMPAQYKNVCAVTAYRDYYLGEKSAIAKWSHSPTPEWFKSGTAINRSI